MTKQRLALILGSSALVTLHLQGCSDDDDDKKSNDCGFTFTEATDITGIGDNTDYPDCAACAAGKLGGSGLNGNGYCANASEAELAPYSNCNTNNDGVFTNGFPIVNTIDFAAPDTWPNNLNGVVQALSDCGAKFGDPLLAALPGSFGTCIGVSTGTTLAEAEENVGSLDPEAGCGLCVVNQLIANGVDVTDVDFGTPSTWPELPDLRKAFAGSGGSGSGGSAAPSNTFPGCGGSWDVVE
jgi:hypothetical protein